MRVARTALAALLTPSPPTLPRPPNTRPAAPIPPPSARPLAQLSVRTEDRTGHQRTHFKHWIDANKDGCNTRSEVLLEEALIAPERTGTCTLTGGQCYLVAG